MNWIFTIVMVTVTAAAIGSAPLAAETAAEKQELVWGLAEYPPYRFTDEHGVNGVDLAVVTLLAKQLGLKLRVVECPIQRCQAYLKAGTIDLLTSQARRPDRERYALYIDPPVNPNIGVYFYVRQDSNLEIGDYADLSGLTIGTKKGAKYSPLFDTDTKVRKDESDSVLLNLYKLAAGRLDAVINTEAETDYLIAKHGLSGKFKKAKLSFHGGSGYIALSKKSLLVDRQAEISAFASQLVRDNFTENLKNQLLERVRMTANAP